jgi:prefoldin subunit 5
MDYEGGINARYLSQHFVEQLCSNEGASQRLVDEIENFIFEKLEAFKKQDANNFPELKEAIILSYDNLIQRLNDEIKECSNEITRINEQKGTLASKNNKIITLKEEIEKIRLPEIKKDDKFVYAADQKKYDENIQFITKELKELKRKIDIFTNVITKIENYNQELSENSRDMLSELSEFNL